MKNHLRAVEPVACEMRVGGFELQYQSGESLRERVVKFARHALPFVGESQIFDLRCVFDELAMRRFEFGEQRLRAFASFGLTLVQHDIYDDEERHRQSSKKPT